MQALLTAITSYCQNVTTGFQGFIGQYTTGNTIQRGPFLAIVPETTAIPYVTMNVLNNNPQQAFRVAGSLAEFVTIRYTLYDYDPDNLIANAELFVSTMDSKASFSLSTGLCTSILRTTGLLPLANQFDKNGVRIYSYSVTYEYRNQVN